MRKFIILLLIIFFSSSAVFVHAVAEEELTVLYFFSATCPHRQNVEPVVKDLSKEFKVQGLVYGKGESGPMPFEVHTGDEETSQRYGIKDLPALAVLVHGKVKQVFRSEHDIQDAKVIVKALARGAMTVTEAAEKAPGIEITITGWIIAKGAYFRKAQFFITDRATDLPVKAWLPLEVMKSPFRKTRPRLMSDVINKPVALRGELIKDGQVYRFQVKEEIRLPEK